MTQRERAEIAEVVALMRSLGVLHLETSRDGERLCLTLDPEHRAPLATSTDPAPAPDVSDEELLFASAGDA